MWVWMTVASAVGGDAPLFAQGSAAQSEIMQSGRRTMTAERMRDDERIVVDGILDEPVWDRAQHGGEFVMQDPVLGGPPTERTEVRIVFNKDHLYIGVTLYDSRARQAQGQHHEARRVPERRRPVHVDDGHVPEPADRLLLRDEPGRV